MAMAASAAEGLGVEIELQLRVAALEAENKALREMFAKEKNHTEKKQTMLALEDIPKEKDHAEKQRMMALEDKAKSAEKMANTWKEKVAATESEVEMTHELYSSLLAESMEYKQKRGAFRRRIEYAWSMFDELNRTLPYKDKLHIRRVGEVQDTTVEKMLTCFKKKHPSLQGFEVEMAVAEKVQNINTTLRGANFRPLKVVSTNDESGNEKNGYAIIYDDPELVSIKEEWDEDIMQDIAEERLRLEKINASGQYASWQVWDSVIDDKMNPFEVAQKLIGMLLDQKSIIDEQKSTIDELMPNQGSRRRRQR